MTGQNSFWFANPSTDFYTETIDQSYRIESSNLSRTPSSDGNRRTFTVSVWVKRTALGNLDIFSTGSNSYNQLSWTLRFNTDDTLYVYASLAGISNDVVIVSKAQFRDTTNWYHFVCAYDSTQGTASNRVKLYANGTQLEIDTGATNHSYGNQNYDTSANDASYVQRIGRFASADANQFSGYFAEFNFIDGTALTPSSFGETKNGVWIPKEITGLTYGTNGFRLTFADSSNLGDDTSGNGNDYTSSGLASTDVVRDSPTNNFSTLNKLDARYGTLAEGNLKNTYASTGELIRSTFAQKKWQVVCKVNCIAGSGFNLGIYPTGGLNKDSDTNYGCQYRGATGQKVVSNSVSSYGATYGVNDIIGIAVDMDNNTVTFYKNNSSQGSISYTIDEHHAFSSYISSGNTAFWNFGQDSSFGGNETAQGNQDDNGIGDFYYSPPSGYLALCSSNLSDTTLSPDQDEQADDYFNTVLYTGNGNSGHAITGVGFQPDWVWIKERNGATNHGLHDSSRVSSGNEAILYSNDTDAESTGGAYLSSFDSDGFTVNNNSSGNTNNDTYVAWNWKANGGTTSSNTNGDITSTVQVNNTAGFSLILYTGFGEAVKTVGHGLSQAPEMILFKTRASGNWFVYHIGTGNTGYTFLNTTGAYTADSDFLNNTTPSSSLITLGASSAKMLKVQTLLLMLFTV